MNDVVNVFVDVPILAKEAVTKNEDGSYSVFIRPDLCREDQLKAYAHALHHITNDDFSKEDVQSIEKDAHDKTT